MVESRWFDPLILMVIMANCITMAWESPLDPPDTPKAQLISTCEQVYLAVFTFELVAKVLLLPPLPPPPAPPPLPPPQLPLLLLPPRPPLLFMPPPLLQLLPPPLLPPSPRPPPPLLPDLLVLLMLLIFLLWCWRNRCSPTAFRSTSETPGAS